MNLEVKTASLSVTTAFTKPKPKQDKHKTKQRDFDEEALIERVSQRIYRAIDD